mgnify:CR=1 FL=1
MNRFLFTSESVTEGHPDKICDQISDAVLDAILEQDSKARVACETVVTTGMVLCMGEISTTAKVDIPQIARDVIVDIGYDRAKFGSMATLALFYRQWTSSLRISQWVSTMPMKAGAANIRKPVLVTRV